MLTFLDEDEVGTCKDEKYDAEHENIAAGVRWHDIKGRSRRRRGTNANNTMFQFACSLIQLGVGIRAGAGLIILLCSIAFLHFWR